MENQTHAIHVTNSYFKADSWSGEDLLGRRGFAEQLARRIRAWRGGKESLVIGLFAPWGAGKTVVKQMTLDALRADKNECPFILEFSPWEWSGHEQITAALFKEIRVTLGKKDSGAEANKIAALVKYCEVFLGTTIHGLEGLTEGAKLIPTLVALVAFALSTATNSLILKWSAFLAGGFTLLLPFSQVVPGLS